MSQIFKLTASLAGHDDDVGYPPEALAQLLGILDALLTAADMNILQVRSVAFPSPSLAVSASRDATVRLWKLQKGTPPKFEADISSHGSSFVNAVTFIKPTADFPEGLVISGGKEGILDVRSTTSSPDKEADAFLPAHEGNICALDVSPDGSIFVSGSWDCSAAIWRTGKWDEPLARLGGHEASVWAVLAYNSQLVITGMQTQLLTCAGLEADRNN
jgi:phospholipase A-2-activating protein